MLKHYLHFLVASNYQHIWLQTIFEIIIIWLLIQVFFFFFVICFVKFIHENSIVFTAHEGKRPNKEPLSIYIRFTFVIYILCSNMYFTLKNNQQWHISVFDYFISVFFFLRRKITSTIFYYYRKNSLLNILLIFPEAVMLSGTVEGLPHWNRKGRILLKHFD